MFGSRVRFSGSAVGGSNGAICGSIKCNMAADGHLGYTKMAITSQPLCRSTYVTFGSSMRFSGSSDGATFSDLE